MCNCRNVNTNQSIGNPVMVKPETVENCTTSLSELTTLKEDITSFILSQVLIPADFNQLNIYRGNILSAINLVNYCYVDINLLNTQINEIKQKYN